MRANKFLGLAAAVSGMALVAAGYSAATASAATATANLSVSATVTNNCTISTAALAFGSYDPVVAHASTNLDGSGTVTVACTKGAVATVGLGLGSNAVRQHPAHDQRRDGVSDLRAVSGLGPHHGVEQLRCGPLLTGRGPSKVARNFTVYGRVASNQDVAAGSYNDTVVATVNF